MTAQVSLAELLHELAERRGLDLRGYKTSSLQRRLRKRMEQLRLKDYSEYQAYLRANPDEVNDLLSTVLINVTEFFRDPQAWKALREEVFPLLFANFPAGSTFRAWCAGCATGEEVYSLAILLAEYFGPKLNEYEIKLYATDNDPEALNIARRAEYPMECLRRVPQELREKYFTGTRVLRVNRDLRRLAIFGRSNLVSDAPISHVQLLICRNVLIYFDSALQRHVLERFRFALDEGGVLFLGKSESQLQGSTVWRVLNPKWRIFQRIDSFGQHRRWEDEVDLDRTRKENESLRGYQRELLQTLRPGVLILDANDIVMEENDSALAMFGMGPVRLIGQRLENTPLARRCPELIEAVNRSRGGSETIRLQVSLPSAEEGKRVLSITIRPIGNDAGGRSGTLIYAEDITSQEKLHSTIEELETTAEELHSANEELETTNEELQSTNEELETTNEELQSTNEELETTNEELQSLNEELETANTELEARSQEVDALNEHFSQTLSAMPIPVIVVSKDMVLELWNSAAERMFGLPARSAIGLRLQQMPIESRLRKILLKKVPLVAVGGGTRILRRQQVSTDKFQGSVDVHLISLQGTTPGVLLLFENSSAAKLEAGAVRLARAAARRGVRPTTQAVKKSAAKKSAQPTKHAGQSQNGLR